MIIFLPMKLVSLLTPGFNAKVNVTNFKFMNNPYLVVNCLSWVPPEADLSQVSEGIVHCRLSLWAVRTQCPGSLEASVEHASREGARELGSWEVCLLVPVCHLLVLFLELFLGTAVLPCMWVSVPSQPGTEHSGCSWVCYISTLLTPWIQSLRC